MIKIVGEIVRKCESEFVNGTTQISKHVSHSMHETLERIDAYHNSKHITGEKDSQGRDKPFFNINIANTNVWYRATDIDRSWIKVRATKSQDWYDSFLATIHLQDWMRRQRFGQFLNEWGRVLAKYGSAVVKFVESDGELSISVIPWNTLIVDSVDFDANQKIEILELTESQLRLRVESHGYAKDIVDSLIETRKARETVGGKKKDNKNDYIKLYELHGVLSKAYITDEEKDEDKFNQQMHVISFVGEKKGRKTEYQDFSLFSGEEKLDPYMITHLIKEDGRTLSKGSVEHLFESQWMQNHSIKSIKDSLDLASKIIFQTSDTQFIGRNALNHIETGDILIHGLNAPITQVNNSSLDIVSQQNFAAQWKSLGNEITGVSEAMLGETPKSGTAWRQTEAVLAESRSLFEQMTENKGLYIEDMLRERIIPNLKTKMDTAKEVSATLEQYDIDRIDSRYIKNKAIMLTNKTVKDKILKGELFEQEEQATLIAENEQNISDTLKDTGNQRFFAPSELGDKTWKEQFKNLEWDLEIDITAEARDVQESMTTLSTALQVSMNPAFAQNKKAQAIVGKILELTSVMSPVEYNAIPDEQPAQQPVPQGGGVPNLPIKGTPGSGGVLQV